ncbi:MAG: hypothetical protein H7Z12_11735 [Rhodospirillaceae bacterium]|nr:hypothetical protein [Rhodospirillales bacterium]
MISPLKDDEKERVMKAVLLRISAMFLAVSAVASCTYQGGDIGDPLIRKAQWFSFVEGEDIRATCAAGTPDRARLVYNGIYDEQLRIYEVDAVRRLLTIRVIQPGNAARLSGDDLTAPWRALEEKVQLDQPSYDRLVESFAQGGVYAPPPVGLELPSRSYFWTAATCKNGQYGFTAWKYPSAEFDRLGFDKNLLALDPTGVPVNQPKPAQFDPQWEDKAKRLETPVFSLRVAAHGLVH